MIGSHAIKTWSSTQDIIATSSREAEYYALVKCGSQALGLKAMMEDLGFYVANYSAAQCMNWGRNQGCGFVKSNCRTRIDDMSANVSDPTSNTICSNTFPVHQSAAADTTMCAVPKCGKSTIQNNKCNAECYSGPVAGCGKPQGGVVAGGKTSLLALANRRGRN